MDYTLDRTDYNGILLFENLVESGITNIQLDCDIKTLELLMDFHDKKYNIQRDHNIFIGTTTPALLTHFDIDYIQWNKLVKLATFVDYSDLLSLLILIGAAKRWTYINI